MSSDIFIGDVWIGIGPLKLQLTWPLLLAVGVGLTFVRIVAVVAVFVVMRNRGRLSRFRPGSAQPCPS